GAMKSEFEYVTGDDDSPDKAVKDNPGPGFVEHGPFMHKFTEPGVYIFLCQNHFGFGMAGVIVVGPQHGGNQGKGWSPAMTTSGIKEQIMQAEEDPRFAKTISMKINNALRPFVWNGTKKKGIPKGESPTWK
ncbi:MAG: plastocyanin/azurin family copper-binding protein, partial [Halobacteriaceae archaeon]